MTISDDADSGSNDSQRSQSKKKSKKKLRKEGHDDAMKQLSKLNVSSNKSASPGQLMSKVEVRIG